MEAIEILAVCSKGAEPALGDELKAEGAWNIRLGYRSVRCAVSEELYYRLHLRLRTASRLFRFIKSVPAGNPRILFDKARRVQWRQYIDPTKPLKIEAVCADGTAAKISPSEVGSKLREAIEEHFVFHTQRGLSAGAREAKVIVSAHLSKGHCQLCLGTHGESLHKRGYREPGHPATMKEHLAAAMLRLAGYDGTQDLVDACCGSGTLAIEAALMALQLSPQHLRGPDDFGLTQLPCFNEALWQKVLQEERTRTRHQLEGKIVAADISQSALSVAKRSAELAGVAKHIEFRVCDLLEQHRLGPSGLLVANLPYDQRLHVAELAEFYRRIGDRLKHHFGGWRAALVVGADSPWKQIGLRPAATHALVNGALPIRLVIFDLFAGKWAATRGPFAPAAT